MKDFQEQNENPYYESLNSGNTGEQNNSSQYQTSIQVNQQNINDVRNAVFSSSIEPSYCLIPIFTFLVGILASSFMLTSGIYDKDLILILLSPIPLVFTIFGCCFGSCANAWVDIKISPTLGIIKIGHKRICCCFNKEKIIQINEVQKVIIQTNEGLFTINFKLLDESEVNGWIKLGNKNSEGRRAFQVLKRALPQRIIFEGDIDNQF